MTTLQQDIHAVIEAANMQAGIAIRQIETGEQIEINGSQPFPMASVFKIPILATAGLQLKAGKIDLNSRVTVRDEDKSAGSGILPFFEAGVSPTVRDLLTLMIIISDNTATDMTVDLLGGPQIVESAMHNLGLTDIYFKMNCKQLLKTLFPPEISALPLDEIKKWAEQNDIVRDGTAFSTGSDNNVSTAQAMTELVTRLFQGQIVDGTIHEELLAILYKQQLNDRLPRFLPPGTPCAHKTGTIGGVRNDSGVITISDHNHVAITVFTWWDDQAVWNQPEAERQRMFDIDTAIGRIGRLAYNHFQAKSA
jgi:beta-lactamase class A